MIGDGIVVTAAHNTGGGRRPRGESMERPDRSDGSESQIVRVQFGDGREEDGTLAGSSEQFDLAVINVDSGGVTPLEFGDATAVAVGTQIATVAAPGGHPRTTPGTIAAVDSRLRTRSGSPVDRVFEHTAPLLRGASGGPVLDDQGKVVGLNINRLEGGLYQALTADDDLRAAIDQLAEGRALDRARLGVTITPDRHARRMRDAVGLPEADGALIADVANDSAAAAAGLVRGDLIIEIDDQPVRSAEDLLLALRRSGSQIALTVIHGGTERRDVTVSL